MHLNRVRGRTERVYYAEYVLICLTKNNNLIFAEVGFGSGSLGLLNLAEVDTLLGKVGVALYCHELAGDHSEDQCENNHKQSSSDYIGANVVVNVVHVPVLVNVESVGHVRNSLR